MAFVVLYKNKLRKNYDYLDKLFKKHDIEWGIVSKLLCGNKDFLKEVIELGIKEIHDARVSNLQAIKEIDSSIQTVYIKPPARRSLEELVKYADVSFNTEFSTIKQLSDEAVKQDKTHKVIIMIEMGDLREGVMGDELIDFFSKVFGLPNIKIAGIGTNLNCMYGVMPSEDKLIQLSLYKQLIEAKFERKIPYVSGGTSVVIPLLLKNRLPKGVDHFRVGETLYFGNDLFEQKQIQGMAGDCLKLYAEIIELTKKPKVPTGELGEDPQGEITEVKEEDYGKTSYRAILDIGLLDIDPEYIEPEDDKLTIAGASSDMLIMDLGATKYDYRVGSLISFRIKYMGALALLNSDYIGKKVEEAEEVEEEL